MKNIYNYRSKKVFSGKTVKVYPRSVPTDERYSLYIESIRKGCENRDRKVSVLELGCGTGRYFHFLKNVEKLTGIDISADMIKAASKQVNSIPELKNITELVNSSIEDFNTEEKFDFIYSIGTLGEYCEFNKQLLEKILCLLKPDGSFFFTIVDSESYQNNEYIWPRKKLQRFLLKLLPKKWRSKIDASSLITEDWKELFLTEKQLKFVLESADYPLKWEIGKAKDNLHIHHYCRAWLMKPATIIPTIIDFVSSSSLSCIEQYAFVA